MELVEGYWAQRAVENLFFGFRADRGRSRLSWPLKVASAPTAYHARRRVRRPPRLPRPPTTDGARLGVLLPKRAQRGDAWLIALAPSSGVRSRNFFGAETGTRFHLVLERVDQASAVFLRIRRRRSGAWRLFPDRAANRGGTWKPFPNARARSFARSLARFVLIVRHNRLFRGGSEPVRVSPPRTFRDVDVWRNTSLPRPAT